MSFWNPIDNPFMGAGIVLLALSYGEAARAGTGLQGFATNAATYIGLPLAAGTGLVLAGGVAVAAYNKVKEHFRQKRYEEQQQQAWLEEVMVKEKQLEQERTKQEQERTKREQFRSYVSEVNKSAENIPENNKLNTDEIRENYEKFISKDSSGEFFNPKFCYDKATMQQAKTSEEQYLANTDCKLSYPMDMFKMVDYNESKETLYLRLETKEYKIENVPKENITNKDGVLTVSAKNDSIREVNFNDYKDKELNEREKIASYHKFREHADIVQERYVRLTEKEKNIQPIEIKQGKSKVKTLEK